MKHPLLPQRNDHGYEVWTATPTPRTLAILSSNDAKRNFMYRQLHIYRPRY